MSAKLGRLEALTQRLFDEREARTASRVAEVEAMRKEVGRELKGTNGEDIARWKAIGQKVALIKRSMKKGRGEDDDDDVRPGNLEIFRDDSIVGLRRYDLSSLEVDEAVAREKAAEIREIECGVRELKQMYDEVGCLVHADAPKLDMALKNIDSARGNVRCGANDIRKSRKLRKRFLFF